MSGKKTPVKSAKNATTPRAAPPAPKKRKLQASQEPLVESEDEQTQRIESDEEFPVDVESAGIPFSREVIEGTFEDYYFLSLPFMKEEGSFDGNVLEMGQIRCQDGNMWHVIVTDMQNDEGKPVAFKLFKTINESEKNRIMDAFKTKNSAAGARGKSGFSKR